MLKHGTIEITYVMLIQVYGLHSINVQSSQIWNFMVNKFPKLKLNEKSKSVCKKVLTLHFLESYKNIPQ